MFWKLHRIERKAADSELFGELETFILNYKGLENWRTMKTFANLVVDISSAKLFQDTDMNKSH